MPKIETVDVAGSLMDVFVYEPPGQETGQARSPALVLCQHLPGHGGIETDEFTKQTAQRYANAGYVVAVPFIFHWWPKWESRDLKRDGFRDDWTMLDLKAAADLVEQMDHVDPAWIGIVGHCWGGRVAWLGAATDPRYAACVVFYGGRIRLGLGPGSRPAIERAKDIACPVAGFFGNDDQNPSREDVDAYDSALSSAGIRHEFHRYDGAGHAFQCFPNEERFRLLQSEDAWRKALGFLERELRDLAEN